MKRVSILLCLWVVILTPGVPRAEVSAGVTPGGVNVLILGITEGPDPIPMVFWGPIRDVDPSLYLNVEGAVRGDGRPHVSTDPQTGWPHVVWAYNNGDEHDIAYATWTGSEWSATSFISVGPANDCDPRIDVGQDGTIRVVWWRTDGNNVFLTELAKGAGGWSVPESVTGSSSGRRPSVVDWNGQILVAYERDVQQSGDQEVVVATRQNWRIFSSEVVASPAWNESLDVMLHSEHGRLWLDWRHSDSTFAYSERQDESWTPAELINWTDTSWTGLEEARLFIRNVILSGS